MRHNLTLGLILLIGLIIPSHSYADWVEAKSDNFIFVGDTSEKRAIKIVEELEKYRSVIFTLYQLEVEQEAIPVRVFGGKSNTVIRDMTGNENASGVYKPMREGPLFILNIKGGFTHKSQARAIAMHEYTHHLLSNYTDQMYPRWINEGMAEYLSTFQINEKGDVKIGLPKQGRGYTLGAYEWMDWDRLTGSIWHYPYGNDNSRNTQAVQQLFYAQSWLAVHYMQSTPGMLEKMTQYVQGVPQTNDRSAFFQKVFGQTPAEFGEELEKYYKRNSYPGRKASLGDNYDDIRVISRKLSKGEAEFQRGEAVRRFRSHSEEGRTLAEKYYNKAEENSGPLAQINASRALISLAAGETRAARDWINSAKSVDAQNSRVMHIDAKVAFAEYQDYDIPSTTEDLDTVRNLLMKALRANPDNMQAHFDYVTTYSLTGDMPSKQAVSSAKQATLYYRSPAFMGMNLQLAPVLSRGDAPDYARYHYHKAALWAPTSAARRSARKMLERLQ